MDNQFLTAKKKKSTEVIVEEWTLASFKEKFGPWRLFCCEDTVSSSMNNSVFVRNRVMFNASIQISLPTQQVPMMYCV